VKETVDHLAPGLVSIVNAFNPCLLILGGGVIEVLPGLLRTVEAEVRASGLRQMWKV
jgi:glucokinase